MDDELVDKKVDKKVAKHETDEVVTKEEAQEYQRKWHRAMRLAEEAYTQRTGFSADNVPIEQLLEETQAIMDSPSER